MTGHRRRKCQRTHPTGSLSGPHKTVGRRDRTIKKTHTDFIEQKYHPQASTVDSLPGLSCQQIGLPALLVAPRLRSETLSSPASTCKFFDNDRQTFTIEVIISLLPVSVGGWLRPEKLQLPTNLFHSITQDRHIFLQLFHAETKRKQPSDMGQNRIIGYHVNPLDFSCVPDVRHICLKEKAVSELVLTCVGDVVQQGHVLVAT